MPFDSGVGGNKVVPLYAGGQVRWPAGCIFPNGIPSTNNTDSPLGTIAIDNATQSAFIEVGNTGINGFVNWAPMSGQVGVGPTNITPAGPIVVMNTGGNPGVYGTAVAATTINTINTWVGGGWALEQYNTTAETAVAPILSSANLNNGLNIDAVTGAASKSLEITEGNLLGAKNVFVTGTSNPFFVRATFLITTLADVTDLYVGFRKLQTYQATLPAGYTDYAAFGVHGTAGLLESQTQIGSGGNVVTTSGINVTAGVNFTIQVNVDGSGNASYSYSVANPATPGVKLTPAITVPYAFTAALDVIPYCIYTTPAGGHAEVDLVNWIAGYA